MSRSTKSRTAQIPTIPSKDLQRQFWDGWNAAHRLKGLDGYMERQRELALHWVTQRRPETLLEVGCGTGWLCNALSPYTRVTGLDLSPASIAAARAQYPDLAFIEGDVEQVDPGVFDFVVSADVISHVEDQRHFIERIAGWTRPGGSFLLMTQNAFVWSRSSYLSPPGDGQIRNWPSLRRLRGLLAPWFTIRHVSTIVPGGDRGILRVVNHRLVKGVLHRIVGPRRAMRCYERAFLGREWVLVADRN